MRHVVKISYMNGRHKAEGKTRVTRRGNLAKPGEAGRVEKGRDECYSTASPVRKRTFAANDNEDEKTRSVRL
jgi:hypothetical protein